MIKEYVDQNLNDLYLTGFERNNKERFSFGGYGFNFILNNGEKSK
jgi:hypothetical protein